MENFALYRLPEQKEYHIVEGRTEELKDIGELDGRSGFVLAPFSIGGVEPLLLIDPEHTATKDVPEAPAGGALLTVLKEDGHREDYHRDFETFHKALEDGTVEKIVLSRRLDLTMSCEVDAREAFFKACRMYPHQMIALVSTEQGGTWLMATPEVLLERDKGDDSWKTMALAGTMTEPGPWSEKNIMEQYYVARYVLYTIGRYSYLIRHSAPYTTSAAKLYHIRTDFSFDVNSDSEAFEVLHDLHPTPAVCGQPKDEASSIILNHESVGRKYYSGFCGPLGLDGETHLFVSLRCMEIDGSRCQLYAGGGLLKESDEDGEWKETEVKLKTMKDVLG